MQLDDDREARPRLAAPSRDLLMRFLMRSFEREHALRGRGWVDRELKRMQVALSELEKDGLLALLSKSLFRESNRNRILSLSLRPDIEDLWERYGDHHRGYCLEFHNEEVFKQEAFLVHYSNDEYVLDVTDEHAVTAHFFFHKTTHPVDWSVQQEVRIVRFPRGQPATQAFNPRLLRRIILGRDMPSDLRSKIRETAGRRALPIIIDDDAMA